MVDGLFDSLFTSMCLCSLSNKYNGERYALIMEIILQSGYYDGGNKMFYAESAISMGFWLRLHTSLHVTCGRKVKQVFK